MTDFVAEFESLYEAVLKQEQDKFHIKDKCIRDATRVMHYVYHSDPSWAAKFSSNSSPANYNQPEFRCAYLHKYSICHTEMVYELMKFVISNSGEVNTTLGSFGKETLNICSLGGGPGCDILGLLASVSTSFQFNSYSVSIVDVAIGWENTFQMVEKKIETGKYSAFERVKSRLHSEYLFADLLNEWTPISYTRQIVAKADIITMVKFVSAAACSYNTERMVQRIFKCMKPGSMLLFLDNACKGFDHLMEKIAKQCGATVLYGPLHEYFYENLKFKIERYGFSRQHKAIVAFIIFYKPALQT